MPADHAGPADAAGFTLLEVLVVLVIMSLMMAIFITRATTRHPALDLRATAAAIADGLRTARSRAIATDRPCVVVLDRAARNWKVGDAPPLSLPAGVTLRGVTTTFAAATDGLVAVIGFEPDGSSTGGRIGLAAGQDRATVAVDWLTGRVSVDAQ